MGQSSKRNWTKPVIKRFETADDVWAYYDSRVSDADRMKLSHLLKHQPTTHDSH